MIAGALAQSATVTFLSSSKVSPDSDLVRALQIRSAALVTLPNLL